MRFFQCHSKTSAVTELHILKKGRQSYYFLDNVTPEKNKTIRLCNCFNTTVSIKTVE